MASLKVKFHPSTISGNEGTIYYQIIHERIVRQWFSDYRVFENEWDSQKSEIRINHESERSIHLLSIKERIKCDTVRFRHIISEFTSKRDYYTTDEIIDEFSRRYGQQSFFCFMRAVILKLKELNKQRTSETYTSALNSLRRYRDDKDIFLDNFNSDLMESYEAYLSKRGLIPNSISFHMRILRAVYNRAIEKGITENRHPFKRVYTGIEKTKKRAVDIHIIKKIKEVDLKMNHNADFARDMFLLSFFFRGMSFVDMAFLRKSDLRNGYIVYRRRKTGQLLSIKWTSEMSDILNKYPENKTEYLLPIITSISTTPNNQYRSKQFYINKGLKTVANRIGLDMPLTLYCSRHSWASIAKSEGIPIGVISDGLGHDSELTTQIYLSTLDTSAVDKANALILKLL